MIAYSVSVDIIEENRALEARKEKESQGRAVRRRKGKVRKEKEK